MTNPYISKDEFAIVDNVIEKLGKDIRIGLPLGVGKANHIVNAFYQRAREDSSLSLKIYTALTLVKPKGKSLLEKRFIEPFADRVFGDWVDPQYEIDQQKNSLPDNVTVYEFYFPAGKKVGNRSAQENYVSSNYTHVARDLFDAGVNVIAQIVADSKDGKTYSLSCNPDTTLDLLRDLRKKKPYPFVAIGQVNSQLPFMYGDAIVKKSHFDYVLDNPDYNYKIFGPPKMSVSIQDYAIGLYASTLIKDGGELQVGIGSLGDSLVYSLLLRQNDQKKYHDIVNNFGIIKRYNKVVEKKGGLTPFDLGLFGASEMFVDGFMHLFDAGILKRRVYDHVLLQRLLNEGVITEEVNFDMLCRLLERRVISPKLSKKNLNFLQHFGIFKDEVQLEDEKLILKDGSFIDADLNMEENLNKISEKCLGSALKKGAVIHGGFFLGPNAFYQWLRDLPDEKRKLIHMKCISKINQLYGHEELDKLHRRDARFVNTCLMVTLSGAAASDGLEDGQVISGVGGQYNFVAMAHALEDGHSVIQLRSTRSSKGNVESNIVFNYGHITIPRHLRDIVITEYGIADIRGKTDSEVAAALIEISDSRFQDELCEQAKVAGKLRLDYELPNWCLKNTPENLASEMGVYQADGLFPSFPFGTDFTEIEIKLGKALKSLKGKSSDKLDIVKLLAKSQFVKIDEEKENCLTRMKLLSPKTKEEHLYRRLLLAELSS